MNANICLLEGRSSNSPVELKLKSKISPFSNTMKKNIRAFKEDVSSASPSRLMNLSGGNSKKVRKVLYMYRKRRSLASIKSY